MRILISNDDGIDARGLRALVEAVADLGEVVVAAPDTAQSGAGHGITVHHPLTVQRRPFPVTVAGKEKDLQAFSIDGRPADCVRLAVRSLIDEPVDLVLSGINHGANDGICVFYSGTVAAAAEGAILGVPGVSFSAKVGDGPIDYQLASRCCRWVLDGLLANGLAAGDLVNVNIPDLHRPDWPLGVRVARQSTAELQDHYILLADADGQKVYKTADSYSLGPDAADTDSIALASGYITVTPLHVDHTQEERLAGWLGRSWEFPAALRSKESDG
ncbi:MAG: 5'/3'-nucleotidase SurE [Planctomycetota bacterium]|jgi:5'-nucleotidase